MNNTKKIIYTTVFVVLPLLSFSSVASAQCDTFDFPLTQNNNVLFFNCDSGEIQKIDPQNNTSTIPREKSLGSFIHNFIWSPDGNKALILSENVLAVKQTLEFYSPERELDSLNWWIYDLNTKKSTLLDKKIMSIGWSSNEEVVYNWENKNFSSAKINDSGFKNFTKIADITSDSDDLKAITSPVSIQNILVFPMKKGFYVINTERKETQYHSIPDGIKKILSDPFENKFFIIKSENSLYKFTPSDKSLINTDAAFSAIDLAFLNSNSLAILGTDKKVYSYDISSKTKTLVPLNVSGDISRVFSSGNKEEFVFVIGKNIYRYNIKNSSPILMKKDPSSNLPTISQPINTNATQPTVQLTSQTSKIIYYILAALLVAIAIFGGFVVIKRMRK